MSQVPRSIVSVAAQAVAFLAGKPVPARCTLNPFTPPTTLHAMALHYGMYA